MEGNPETLPAPKATSRVGTVMSEISSEGDVLTTGAGQRPSRGEETKRGPLLNLHRTVNSKCTSNLKF